MSRTVSIILTLALVMGIGIILGGGAKNNINVATNKAVANSELKEGIQYIIIRAKGGYSPKVSTAKAGVPTRLIVKTDGTYDCSASLVIRSLGFQKILAQTGEEVIDIGTPKAELPLQGVCGMGMYNFLIKFSS